MFRDYMAVINGLVIIGRCIVIPEVLQKQVLKQLHISQMGIEKTKHLTCQSVYWIGKTADIENYIKLIYMPWVSTDSTKIKNLFIRTFQVNCGKW